MLERVDQLHAAHPEGFQPLAEPPPPNAGAGVGGGVRAPPSLKEARGSMRSTLGSALLAMNLLDLDGREMADYIGAEVRAPPVISCDLP